MFCWKHFGRQLQKGAAVGPSGTTYQHVIAASQTPDSAIGAALELINTILAGGLPHLQAARLEFVSA